MLCIWQCCVMGSSLQLLISAHMWFKRHDLNMYEGRHTRACVCVCVHAWRVCVSYHFPCAHVYVRLLCVCASVCACACVCVCVWSVLFLRVLIEAGTVKVLPSFEIVDSGGCVFPANLLTQVFLEILALNSPMLNPQRQDPGFEGKAATSPWPVHV